MVVVRGAALRTTVCCDRRRWVCGGSRGGFVFPARFLVVSDLFHYVSVRFVLICFCLNLFGGDFTLFLWWSPHHCFCSASILEATYVPVRSDFRWWCLCFWLTVVLHFHACFSFTCVLFPRFWFTRAFIFDGLELFCSRFPAMDLVILLFQAYLWRLRWILALRWR
jgi:hypothetical protein